MEKLILFLAEYGLYTEEQLGLLTGLYLSLKGIVELLSETIGHLSNLECLYLSENNLQPMPETILGLPNLKYIDLSGNPIPPLK